MGLDIDKLLSEVQVGRPQVKRWYDKISKECLEFLTKVASDHVAGKEANVKALNVVLKTHFDIHISNKSVQIWLAEVSNNEWPRN